MESVAQKQSRSLQGQRFLVSLLAAGALAVGGGGAVLAQGQGQAQGAKSAGGLTSLITETPEEGFALAIKLSQKAVATTQKDASIRKALRPAYAHDPDSLIAVSHVVAVHFQTVAAANDYWRK